MKIYLPGTYVVILKCLMFAYIQTYICLHKAIALHFRWLLEDIL